MSAYLIATITKVHDRALMAEYAKLTAPTIEKFGGKRIGSSAPPVVLEGAWESLRMIIFEFPDMTALDNWYSSDDYKPLIEMRQKAADVTILKIDGAG